MNRFTIKSHRLHHADSPITFHRSPHSGGTIQPQGIILHDTAGRLDKGTTVAWFLDKRAKASAHLVVERDSGLTQLVPFNTKAWHAGQSILNGRSGCNAFSIGIEIVNPGKLDQVAGGYRPWFKQLYTEADGDIRAATTAQHGAGFWMDYSSEQIEVVTAVCCALVAKYNLTFIEPHWSVSPGRKIDTNPLFPLDYLRGRAFGRSEGDDEPALRQVIATSLNVRGGPGIDFEKMDWGPLPEGSVVQVLGEELDERGERWSFILHQKKKGWVCERYLASR